MKQFYTAFIVLFLSFSLTAQNPTGTSTEVGITGGELSVSLSGAANYAIPIAVPPGINEVVPQISLVYNSQGANGLAGYKWNIAGISTITVIPTTKHHDGAINPTEEGINKRFALDGQRLLKKNGGKYFDLGVQGNVYELENFTNVEITSANQTQSPYSTAVFRVSYPDGSFAIYGEQPNHKTTGVWAISYWQNAQGVRISYTYNNVYGKKLTIASIKYGSTTTNTPINEIQFIYKQRARSEQGYYLGQSVTDDTILSKIKVIGNGVGFRNYVLGHDETFLDYERLVSITELNGDETKSYNPTKFEYEKTAVTEGIEAKFKTTAIGMSNINSDTSSTISGDFDGDGKMDFVLYPTKGDLAKKKFWLLTDIKNSSSGFPREVASGSFEEIFPSTFLLQTNKICESQGITAVQSATDSKAVNFNTYFNSIYGVGVMNTKQVTFPTRNITNCVGLSFRTTDKSQSKRYFNGDFNGDGLTDVIAIDNEEKQQAGPCFSSYQYISTYVSTGKVYFIDLDNRKTSNFWIEAGTLTDYFRNYSTFSDQDRIETFDVNGDGKTDILHFKTGSVTVYTLDNTNKLVLLWKTTDANIVTNLSILPGDYNGDGKMDFIIPKTVGLFNSNDYYKFLSKGNAFEKFSQYYAFPNYGSTVISESGGGVSINNLIPLDFNGDGKSDIVHFRTIYGNTAKQGAIIIRSYNNNGTSFSFSSESYIQSTPLIKSYAAPIFLSPNTNNQYVEVAAVSDNLIYTFNSQKNFSKETLLSTITTGNGVKETITYNPLTQDQIDSYYIPASYIETFPNVDINVAPNFNVVTKLEKQSANDYKKQLFNYYGVVSNTEGLGFIGFRSILRTNWHNDTTPLISNISKYDISRRGVEVESYSGLEMGYVASTNPGSYITKTLIEYNSATDALQFNKVFKLKKNSIKQFNGLEDTSSETSFIYDVYNNPTNSTSLLKEGGVTVQTTNSTVSYKDPSVLPFIIGLPATKTQSVAITGSIMSTEEKYEYTTSGLLSEIKKKGTGTGYITEQNIFDAFGNVTKKTISADHITSRVTSYDYDPSGRFLIKSTDVEGLFKTFSYNLNNGLLLSETNQNGLTTSYDYDSWFKKIKTTDYLGKTNNYAYSRSTEKTKITTTGDDGSESEEIFDDLGRKIRTGVKNINGDFSYISYLYDSNNRNYKVSEPYFGSSPTQYNETQYDEYGRIIKSIEYTGKITDISYSGLTTIVNENSKTKTTVKNVMGNIVSVTDAPGGTITYSYYANGNLWESNYSGSEIIITQDGWGRKTMLEDSSAGTYSYEYNDLGEITKETTPNGTTTYILDDYGKIKEKTIVGVGNTNSKTTYTYDSDSKLLIKSKFDDFINGGSITNDYTYDTFRRVDKTIETTQYATFTKEFAYDEFGRVNTNTLTAQAAGKESSRVIKNTYKNGIHWQILDNATSSVLWQTNTLDARGKLLTAVCGPIALANSYDNYGYASELNYNNAAAPSINLLKLTTSFNAQKANLETRTNSLFNRTETFRYDALDRLIEFTNVSGSQEIQIYDDRGRIILNSVGLYNYTNNSKLYQNTSVDLGADALAYYTGRQTLDVTYNTFKSPVEIQEAGIDRISFNYNDNNSRSAMFYGGLQDNKLERAYGKYYSADGSMEIKHNLSTGAVDIITYIGGNGYTAPLILKSDGTSQGYFYLLRDYQSSIIAVADQSGTIVEKRLFDAWGNIASVQDGAGASLAGLTILDRGYTGHEHLQSVGIIHMNGRLYDPKLHRFLQPDNYVQDPFNTQNYNRYGYCWNNPLKYTDPSGEIIWAPIIVGAIIGAIAGGAGYAAAAIKTGNWNWGQFGISVFGGALIGGITGGVNPASLIGTSVWQTAATGFVAGMLPAYGVQVGDWSFSISPAIAFGNVMGVGANLSVGYSSGDFSFSAGIGIMSNSNYSGLGKNGSEIRQSILIAYDDGKNGFSLGSNFWSGDFKQQTGTLGLHFGDFSALYENDGKPFSGISGDGNDQFRTAALSLSIGGFSAGFNLFTGSRTKADYTLENEMEGGALGYSSHGKYGEYYKNGLVHETGPKYRMGAAYFGYKGYRAGTNSEWIRHAIQNVAIHGTPIANQRMFEMQSGDWNGYFQYKTSNTFTSW